MGQDNRSKHGMYVCMYVCCVLDQSLVKELSLLASYNRSPKELPSFHRRHQKVLTLVVLHIIIKNGRKKNITRKQSYLLSFWSS